MTTYYSEVEKLKPIDFDNNPCQIWNVTPLSDLRYYNGKLQQKVYAEFRYASAIFSFANMTHFVNINLWIDIPIETDER